MSNISGFYKLHGNKDKYFQPKQEKKSFTKNLEKLIKIYMKIFLRNILILKKLNLIEINPV